MKYFKGIIILILVAPLSLFAWKMESGTVTLPATTAGSSAWKNVSLQQTYDTAPLIFALTTSGTNPFTQSENPAILRVNNISTTSFDITQVEPMDSPSDINGAHPALTIHYIAIDRGVHYFPDGRMITAGELNTTKVAEETDQYDEIFFPRAFRNTPAVLSMIQSLANEENTLPGQPTRPLLTTATKDVKTESVELALERSKLREGDVVHNETIGYLAIEGGIQGSFVDFDSNTVQYETIVTPKVIQGWDEAFEPCKGFDYSNTYTAEPNLFGNKNTRSGGHGGWLRQCSNSITQAGVTVDEDIYSGSNRTHPVTEIAGLLAVSSDFRAVFEDIDRTPVAEYRMDECYWSGAVGEVKDSSSNLNDATSYNNANIMTTDSRINFSGLFTDDQDQVRVEDSTVGNTNGALTVSFWAKLDQQLGRYAVVLTKSKDWDWNNGWGFVNPNGGASDTFRFYINSYGGTYIETTLSTSDGWTHFVGTYDGDDLRLYKDGAEVTNSPVADASGITNSDDPMRMAFDNPGDSTLKGNLDEVKVWKVALNSDEINYIYNQELDEKNYDGTERSEVVCGASISANTWEMISIPQESRSPTVLGVQDIFGDDFVGANYNAGDTDGWVLWRRDYNDTHNGHHYYKVDYANNEPIDFNKGYWLGSTLSVDWDVDEAKAVDYNSSYNGTIHCASERCVEVALESVNIDGIRYNLSNFPGKTSIDWAKCRFIISDPDGSNVEVLTPKSADASGYVSRTIAIWPGGAGTGGQITNGDYNECHDESVGGCDLLPYHSFWVEVLTPTLGKKIKLLIPEE